MTANLETIAAMDIKSINGGSMELIIGQGCQRYYPEKRVYDFLLEHGYIQPIQGKKTEEGRQLYEVTPAGSKFHEEHFKKPFDETFARCLKEFQPIIESTEAATKITAKDLATMVTI